MSPIPRRAAAPGRVGADGSDRRQADTHDPRPPSRARLDRNRLRPVGISQREALTGVRRNCRGSSGTGEQNCHSCDGSTSDFLEISCGILLASTVPGPDDATIDAAATGDADREGARSGEPYSGVDVSRAVSGRSSVFGSVGDCGFNHLGRFGGSCVRGGRKWLTI